MKNLPCRTIAARADLVRLWCKRFYEQGGRRHTLENRITRLIEWIGNYYPITMIITDEAWLFDFSYTEVKQQSKDSVDTKKQF